MSEPLLFHLAGVRRIVDHTLSADERLGATDPATQQPIPPEIPVIWIVSDSGVYLMGSGLPKDEDTRPGRGGLAYCCYALGCDPHTEGASPAEVDTVRRTALCSDNVSGGDDFGMPIHADELQGILNDESIEASASTATHLQLKVGPSFDPYGTFTQAADFELSLITVQ
jgi:hypothetical protein